ncbi:hypothetical protein JCM10207_009253 [Rhodosporidiobolus poonsookiae]
MHPTLRALVSLPASASTAITTAEGAPLVLFVAGAVLLTRYVRRKTRSRRPSTSSAQGRNPDAGGDVPRG